MLDVPAIQRDVEIDRRPLCVDLDGTLVKTDTLVEGLVVALKDWRVLIRLPGLFLEGKAGLKAGLSELITVDPALLPYDRQTVDFVKLEKSAGRRLILATAANRKVADDINAHLGGLFDEVIASDSNHNLRGADKARALVERYGQRGFDYVGNDRSDLRVWSVAERGVLVNVAPNTSRKAHRVTDVERVLSRRPSYLGPMLNQLRPHQWVKNFLVFVPLVTAGAIGDVTSWVHGVLAFAAFSLIASAIYAVNDFLDLEADRLHPRKCRRPLASGALPFAAAACMIPVLFILGVGLAAWAGIVPLVLGYVVLSVVYSVKLKHMPLVDVFLLSALYTIRLFAGGVATGYEVSLWLLAFSCFLFLGLAIMKRVTELSANLEQRRPDRSGRGYVIADLEILRAFGASASFVSAMVLALYVQSDQVTAAYQRPETLWWIVPLVLFWQCRLWLATVRGYMTDDPIVYSVKDWVSVLVGGGLLITVVSARIGM